MKRIIIALFIFTLSCVSTLLSQTSTGFETLDYLYSIRGTSTLAGQHDRNYWLTMKQIAGDYPALWGEDFMYYPTGGASTMDEWRTMITHDAMLHYRQGAVIALMFHACPPTTTSQTCNWWASDGSSTCDGCIHSTLTNQQWTDLLTDGTTLNNNWKARLDEIYPYLKQLQDAGVEVLFRLFHEMNQGFFWWAGQGKNTANLYKLSHDYLVKTKGLTNLIWVWNVQDFSSLTSDLNSYDPGSDYWDVLALDVYSGSNQSGAYSSSKYNAIVAKAAGKPIAIGECQLLPTAATLNSQPLWTYFMGWSSLVQANNSNATISSIYNSYPRVLTLSRTGRAPDVNYNDTLICNFDDVYPYITVSGTSGIGISTADAPTDSPASGQMGVLSVPQNNLSGLIKIYLDTPVDPRKYIGISFLAQSNYTDKPVPFVTKLGQSADNIAANQIQDYTTQPAYNGNGVGGWQEVHIPFNVLLGSSSSDQLGYKLNQNPNFPASDYDILMLLPAYNQKLPAFTLNIDDINFRTSWGNETGIPATKLAALIITAENGMIKATGANGNPVFLKVYSISGQEVINGTNQVQIGIKGAYIVKATTGNITDVQKIVVQ